MDISVLVSWRTTYDHVAWSVGYCKSCQQLEAVRVENAIRVVSIWFIPMTRHVIGKTGRCDFCGRPIDNVLSLQEVPLSEWRPPDGLKALADRLGVSAEISIPTDNSNARLRSLLAATKSASSINEMDITFGITTGILVGIALCLPVGIYLFDNQIVRLQMDRTAATMASVLTGVVLGAVVGAAAHALLKRGKVALRKIEAACENYRLDTRRLEVLSHDYGGPVRRAVSEVRQTAGYAGARK